MFSYYEGFESFSSFFTWQGRYYYPYIPPLLEDSVHLLIQAVNKSTELCSNTSDSVDESLDELCNDTASFSNLVSSVLLETSFEGNTVMACIKSSKFNLEI